MNEKIKVSAFREVTFRWERQMTNNKPSDSPSGYSQVTLLFSLIVFISEMETHGSGLGTKRQSKDYFRQKTPH